MPFISFIRRTQSYRHVEQLALNKRGLSNEDIQKDEGRRLNGVDLFKKKKKRRKINGF